MARQGPPCAARPPLEAGRIDYGTLQCDRGRTEQVWPVDFQFDSTTEGRPVKIVFIVDELDRLAADRGTPPCCATTSAPS